MVVNTPEDSTTYSAPALLHGMAAGSFSVKTVIFLPKWKEYGFMFEYRNCKTPSKGSEPLLPSIPQNSSLFFCTHETQKKKLN